MRLALALMAPLLPYVAAQVVVPEPNAAPTAKKDAPVPGGGTTEVGPPPVKATNAPVDPPARQAAPSTSTPNAPAAAATPVRGSGAAASQPTAAPTPTTPSFQFDMASDSVYTACQTQDVIWHYRPNPEKAKVSLYVYNQAAAESNAIFAGAGDPEPTASLGKPPKEQARRDLPNGFDRLAKRQSADQSADTPISHVLVKDWGANVAYSWVVDVPPGEYKFMAVVDGQGADLDYALKIVESSNMTCVKEFGGGSASSSSSSSSSASSSDRAGGASTASSTRATPSTNAGAAGSSDGDKGSGGISGGAIAGIVIGVLAGLGLLVLLALCWRKKRRDNDSSYRVDPYDEPVREVRSRSGGFAPMSSANDHETSSFGHGNLNDDIYGGMVAPPARAAQAQNPFETEPNTPVDERQMGTTQSSHTPNSSLGNASVYTAAQSAESELAYPPPVGLLPVAGNNRASAQSGTSTYESAHTQAHPGSIQTFGHQSDRLNSFPSNRTLASADSHFVPGADAPPLPAVPVAAAGASPPRSPRAPPSPPSPPSLQRTPSASPRRPTFAAENVSGGAPAPSAFGPRLRSGSAGELGAADAVVGVAPPTVERKISSRRKPVPQLSEDEEAALGTSPQGSSEGSRRGSNEAPLRLPKLGAPSSEGHEDWGSGLQDAIQQTGRGQYTLMADPPLRQD